MSDPSSIGMSWNQSVGVMPEDRAHLQQLIEEALTEWSDEAPERDEDGDFPIRTDDAEIILRPFEDQAVMELMAPVLVDIQNPPAAEELATELNGQPGPIKFIYTQGAIVAFAYIFTTPWVSDHLSIAIGGLSETIASMDDELDKRVSGDYVVERG